MDLLQGVTLTEGEAVVGDHREFVRAAPTKGFHVHDDEAYVGFVHVGQTMENAEGKPVLAWMRQGLGAYDSAQEAANDLAKRKRALPRSKKPLSPSGLQSGEDCLRLWGWTYLEGLRSPNTEQTIFGTDVHAHLERWFLHGTVPPDTAEGDCARRGLRGLPAPNPHMVVEGSMDFEQDGIVYKGFADLRWWTGESTYIVDHKSTSSVAWAKGEDELRTNIQAVIYAEAALRAEPSATYVDLHWNYVERKKGGKQKITKIRMTREEVRERFDYIHEQLGQPLIKIRNTVKHATELPPSPEACGNYNGCPHQLRCGLTAKEKLRIRMAQSARKVKVEMGLRDRLKAQREKQAGGTASAPATPPTPEPSPNASNEQPSADVVPINPPESAGVPQQASPVVDTRTDEEKAPKKRSPGRPKGSKNKPAAATAEVPAETPAATVTPVAAVSAPAPALAGATNISVDLGPLARGLAMAAAVREGRGDPTRTAELMAVVDKALK